MTALQRTAKTTAIVLAGLAWSIGALAAAATISPVDSPVDQAVHVGQVTPATVPA